MCDPVDNSRPLIGSSVDNVFRPRLVGQDTRMHELLMFFSTLGTSARLTPFTPTVSVDPSGANTLASPMGHDYLATFSVTCTVLNRRVRSRPDSVALPF